MDDWRWKYKAKVLRVIDGDSIVCSVDLGFRITQEMKLRLSGINTPETYGVSKESAEYQAGMRAKEYLRQLIEGKDVVIVTEKDMTEKYGRYLAIVFIDDVDVNQRLLKEGFAKVY